MQTFSKMILVVEALNSHVYSLIFVAYIWIKIGQNEHGWCLSFLGCLPSFTPQMKLALVMPMTAMLTTMAPANGHIHFTIRAGQWHGFGSTQWCACVLGICKYDEKR